MDLNTLLAACRQKKIGLAREGGNIRVFQANKLTDPLRSALRAHKSELLKTLPRVVDPPPPYHPLLGVGFLNLGQRKRAMAPVS